MSNLRTAHFPCQYIFTAHTIVTKAHVALLNLRNVHVTLSNLKSGRDAIHILTFKGVWVLEVKFE